ncbi:MAG: alpha/beta hydrolase [Actinobacteria bacterium]|nr:alpha/beta hydrolase [Actinomycetota bacterium]
MTTDERKVILLSHHESVWKHVAPLLSGMDVLLGPNIQVPESNFAAVGHASGGRQAQQLAIDSGAKALVLMNCEILPGREHDLRALAIPTFILWGEDDIVDTVEVAFRLNELIKGSTLALVPGCGRDLPEQAPDVVGSLITDFLRSQWLGIAHGHAVGPVHVDLGRKPRA